MARARRWISASPPATIKLDSSLPQDRMCGIGFAVIHAGELGEEEKDRLHRDWWERVKEGLRHRGPDHDSLYSTDVLTHRIELFASVLGLRGSRVTPQPLHSRRGAIVLCWNGEIFEWQGRALEGDGNDGEFLLGLLEQRLEGSAAADRADVIKGVLSDVEGPFAFILLDREDSKLYYGRDCLGRRSLVVTAGPDKQSHGFIAASAQCRGGLPRGDEELLEVKPGRLCVRGLRDGTWSESAWAESSRPRLVELREPSSSQRGARDALSLLHSALGTSVKQRVIHIRQRAPQGAAQLGVFFSGGLDCTTLALLAHQHMEDLQEPIELLNVAFENPRALKAAREERERAARKVAGRDGKEHEGEATIDPYEVPDRLTARASFLELQRLAPQRPWRLVEINVPYFEYQEALDEIHALISPLKTVMDVSLAAVLYFAARGRGKLSSVSQIPSAGTPHEATCSVVLSGLGADELLGGYSRHRAAFKKGGEHGLVDELQLDLDRIPTRNLGRDDRIVSRWAREVRYPFLAKKVVELLCDLPVSDKMDLTRDEDAEKRAAAAEDEEGKLRGDKLLLRRLALSLGLEGAAGLPKVAMQFGSRSAKMESGKVKGHEAA